MTKKTVLSLPVGQSLINIAKPGEPGLYSKDRVAIWANFLVDNVHEYKGFGERDYTACKLPGDFYSKDKNANTVKPHIELNRSLLLIENPFLAHVFSQAGNTLLSPLWLVPEVKAIKRVLHVKESLSLLKIVEIIGERRANLIKFYTDNVLILKNNFTSVQDLLYSDLTSTSKSIYGDIPSGELLAFIPLSPAISLNIKFDKKLKEAFPGKYLMRVGVWNLECVIGGIGLKTGVVTPRITYNSIFKDPLYKIDNESDLALLVRCVLLSRLLKLAGLGSKVSISKDFHKNTGFFLKAIPLKQGQKNPEPSYNSLLNFINNNHDATSAWAELTQFFGDRLQTAVTFKDFNIAFNNASDSVKKFEDVSIENRNIILPVVWSQNGLMRVTYVSPKKNMPKI